MSMNARAKAQALETLDEAARQLKRMQSTCRTSLQAVRQAQAQLTGIEVETINTDPSGGHSVTGSSEVTRV